MLKADPKTILVICHQRIGDVLYITPVIASLKARWPAAQIDVLVTEHTEAVLVNNPNIRTVITVPRRPSFTDRKKLIRQLWRSYDLSIATTANSKSITRGFLFSKYRVGFYQKGISGWLKKLTLNKALPYEDKQVHFVRHNLKLIEILNIEPLPTVTVHWSEEDQAAVDRILITDKSFIVLHPFPKFQYKMWAESEWKVLITWLLAQNFDVILTGSDLPVEMDYIEKIRRQFEGGVTSLAGKLSLSMMRYLMSKASGYVGVDTAPTHIAASSGIPTVALFGPSDPIKWGPWPHHCTSSTSPYVFKGSPQRQGNVTLLQSDFSCVPCLNEGCESHVNSKSQCLELFPAEKVIQELSRFLKS